MRIIRAKFLPNQHFWDLGCQRVLFECPEVKKRYCSTKSPCKKNINWNHQKSSHVSYYVHPGFTFPNFHQIYVLTIILSHQLHNQSQISALCLGTTLCHPHECNYGVVFKPNGRRGLKCKQAKSPTKSHENVKKLIKHGFDQSKFPSMLEPIL